MPKLLVFTPCERVVGIKDPTPSLVSIFTKIEGRYTTKHEPPPRILSPYQWSAFVFWKTEEEDTGKEFTQTLRMKSPYGDVAMTAENTFKAKGGGIAMPSIATFEKMPVLPSGPWSLELYLNEKGSKVPDVPLATFDIEIRTEVLITPPAEPKTQADSPAAEQK